MWFSLKLSTPYWSDEDYKQAIVFDIKSKIGDVPVDVTCIKWGYVEINCEDHKMLECLNQTFFTGEIRGSCDRGMIGDEQRTIL